MSWLFSQALVEEYSEDCLQDSELSVLSKSNHIQQAHCAKDKMTNFSRLSRFGMTCELLTESLGAELLMWYLADFRAKTLAAQEKAQELQELEVDCGKSSHELLAKYDHASCSWKIAHSSRNEVCMLFSGTWPKCGTMRNGNVYLQNSAEQTMKETDFGSLDSTPPSACR
jgi:hypothetical protein